MDRELVLGVLVAVLCGGVLTASGFWSLKVPDGLDSRTFERRTWRRLWFPFVPALLMLAALVGWALAEPANAERVPDHLLWGALPFGVIYARAAWRALRSLSSSNHDQAAATVGFFRPQVVIAPHIVRALGSDALAAVLEHEQAHVRHHDPLRLWMAQIATDLFWPWPAAHSRLTCWRRALELARDDEARLSGAAGPDLAAAILTTLRLSGAKAPSGVATLGADDAFLKQRVARLLQPLQTPNQPTDRSAFWLLVPAALVIGMAVILGSEFGERAVQILFEVV